jgi:hypothetical protein
MSWLLPHGRAYLLNYVLLTVGWGLSGESSSGSGIQMPGVDAMTQCCGCSQSKPRSSVLLSGMHARQCHLTPCLITSKCMSCFQWRSTWQSLRNRMCRLLGSLSWSTRCMHHCHAHQARQVRVAPEYSAAQRLTMGWVQQLDALMSCDTHLHEAGGHMALPSERIGSVDRSDDVC